MRKIVPLLLALTLLPQISLGAVSERDRAELGVAKNYLKGADESAAAGWKCAVDPAIASPVSTASVTIASSSSAPLAGNASLIFTKTAGNLQNYGCYYDFTVENADAPAVLQALMDVVLNSGTYSDGDAAAFLYDVTNNVLKPLDGTISAYSIRQTYTGKAQTSTATSYRFILRVATTTTNAFSFKLDNFSLSRPIKSQGPPVSDGQSYTPTFTGMGAVTGVDFVYWQLGDRMRIVGKWTTGTPTATEARVSLPSGLVVDPTKNASIRGVGQWYQSVSPANTLATSVLAEPSVNYLTFGFNLTTTPSLTKQNGNSAFASSTTYSLLADIPILGWSSNLPLASQTSEGRVVAFSGRLSSSVVAGATEADIAPLTASSTGEGDTFGAMNLTTGVYTVKVQGWYGACGVAYLSAPVANGLYHLKLTDSSNTELRRLGTTVAQSAAGSDDGVSGCSILRLNTNDQVKFRLSRGGSAGIVTGQTQVSIFYIPGNSGASIQDATVAARYYLTTSQSIGNSSLTQVILAATKDYDYTGSYNPATGLFTAPISGLYEVSAHIGSAAGGGWAAGEEWAVLARKNQSTAVGGYFVLGTEIAQATHAQRVNAGGKVELRLLQGETADVAVFQNSGSALNTLAGDQGYVWVQFKRVGNY